MKRPRIFVVFAAILASFIIGILLITFLAPLHRLLFTVVPADGPVSQEQRSSVDHATVNYLLNGRVNELADYSNVEQSHLYDVRVRMIWLALTVGILSIGLGLNHVSSTEWRLARNWAFGSWLIVGLAFEPLFILMHEVVFPGGNWYLPSSDYIITRIYPEGFFIGCWVLIGLASVGILAGLTHFTERVVH